MTENQVTGKFMGQIILNHYIYQPQQTTPATAQPDTSKFDRFIGL
jgi:hypothetical protein